ncbi:MAG: hypothetical protein SFV52_09785 [Saprospiraceae bacterium]|nr:hypothetical protein [Saprospiraceae bacterium]
MSGLIYESGAANRKFAPMHTLRKLLPHLPAALLLTGALVRFGVWMQDRSLFIDEASLALNFCEKSFAGLWGPLGHQQYAPPLFLMLVKSAASFFGNTEQALRLVPLWSGLLALGLFGALARRYAMNLWVLLGTVWIFAFSDLHIRYATEVKQYGTDAAVALALLWMAQRRVGAGLWAVAGAVSVWLSMPAVFVLFGVGLEGLWAVFNRSNPYDGLKPNPYDGLKPSYGYRPAFNRGDGFEPSPRYALMIVGAWLLSFGVYFLFFLKPAMGGQALLDYHSAYFFPVWPLSPDVFARQLDLLRTIPYYTAGHTALALAFGAAGLLTALVVRLRDARFRLLVWPLLACLAASAAGAYSLLPRMLVWLFPLMLLAQACGWDWLWAKTGRYGRIALAFLMLATAGLHDGLRFLYEPLVVEEVKPVLAQVAARRRSDDLVWIDHQSKALVQWHTGCRDPRFDLGEHIYRAGFDDMPRKEAFAGAARVWVVYTHLSNDAAQARAFTAVLNGVPAGYRAGARVETKGAFAVEMVRE